MSAIAEILSDGRTVNGEYYQGLMPHLESKLAEKGEHPDWRAFQIRPYSFKYGARKAAVLLNNCVSTTDMDGVQTNQQQILLNFMIEAKTNDLTYQIKAAEFQNCIDRWISCWAMNCFPCVELIGEISGGFYYRQVQGKDSTASGAWWIGVERIFVIQYEEVFDD